MRRSTGKDVVRAAQWFYDHLFGRVPIVVIQASLGSPESSKEADGPSSEWQTVKGSISSRADDGGDDDELLEILLNLGIDSPKPTAPRPGPTAPTAASNRVAASRQGVRRCLCCFCF